MLKRTVFGALSMYVLCGLTAHAQVSNGVVRVGVLTDMNGLASDITGKGSVEAARMAAEDFGGKVLGAPIEIISADHQTKADIGSAIARARLDEDSSDGTLYTMVD